MSSPSSLSSSTATSSPRKKIRFMDSDAIVSLPPYTPSDEVSETESLRVPPSPSPNSTTSTLSTSSPYTPPSNFNSDISIEGHDGATANPDSFSPTVHDAVAPLQLDTYRPGIILHTCLTTSTPVYWNMLINPQTLPQPHALHQFGHDFLTHDACFSSFSKMQINCSLLPWPIIMEQDGFNGSPRVEDVFNSIYVSLWKLASSVDLQRETMERQRRIQKEYVRRCRQLSLDEESDGLKRIDFLEGQTIFLGLFPGNWDDEWILHLGQGR